MQLHLGEEAVLDYLQDVPSGDDDLLNAIETGTYWNPDARWDEGWERAGGESFMRRGYTSQGAYRRGEDPVIIEKSGNPHKTYHRGTDLEAAGADIIPTLMVVDDAVDPDTERITGGEYRIFQVWTPASFAGAYENRVTDREGKRSSPVNMSYDEREGAGVLTDDGVDSFARNCAVIDGLGCRLKTGSAMITEFLTDTETCYVVDFGADLGTASGEPHEKMHDAAMDFLTEHDQERFKDVYAAVREQV